MKLLSDSGDALAHHRCVRHPLTLVYGVSLQLHRHCRDFVCVSLYAVCFYPSKVVSLIVGMTIVAVHVVLTFFSIIHWQFFFSHLELLIRLTAQCHKIHTLRRDVVAVSDSSRGARGCALAHSRSSSVVCRHILIFVFTHLPYVKSITQHNKHRPEL